MSVLTLPVRDPFLFFFAEVAVLRWEQLKSNGQSVLPLCDCLSYMLIDRKTALVCKPPDQRAHKMRRVPQTLPGLTVSANYACTLLLRDILKLVQFRFTLKRQLSEVNKFFIDVFLLIWIRKPKFFSSKLGTLKKNTYFLQLAIWTCKNCICSFIENKTITCIRIFA